MHIDAFGVDRKRVIFFQLLPEGVMVGSKLFIASLSEK